jgi:hypothetical protein
MNVISALRDVMAISLPFCGISMIRSRIIRDHSSLRNERTSHAINSNIDKSQYRRRSVSHILSLFSLPILFATSKHPDIAYRHDYYIQAITYDDSGEDCNGQRRGTLDIQSTKRKIHVEYCISKVLQKPGLNTVLSYFFPEYLSEIEYAKVTMCLSCDSFIILSDIVSLSLLLCCDSRDDSHPPENHSA